MISATISYFWTPSFHLSRSSHKYSEHVRRPRCCKGFETLSTIATGPFFGTNPSTIHKYLQISRSKWHTVMACNGRCSMYNSQKDPEETLVEHNPDTHHYLLDMVGDIQCVGKSFFLKYFHRMFIMLLIRFKIFYKKHASHYLGTLVEINSTLHVCDQ